MEMTDEEVLGEAWRNRPLPRGHKVHIRQLIPVTLQPCFFELELDGNPAGERNFVAKEMREQSVKTATQSLKLTFGERHRAASLPKKRLAR
jgi:hypothetical protein